MSGSGKVQGEGHLSAYKFSWEGNLKKLKSKLDEKMKCAWELCTGGEPNEYINTETKEGTVIRIYKKGEHFHFDAKLIKSNVIQKIWEKSIADFRKTLEEIGAKNIVSVEGKH